MRPWVVLNTCNKNIDTRLKANPLKNQRHHLIKLLKDELLITTNTFYHWYNLIDDIDYFQGSTRWNNSSRSYRVKVASPNTRYQTTRSAPSKLHFTKLSGTLLNLPRMSFLIFLQSFLQPGMYVLNKFMYKYNIDEYIVFYFMQFRMKFRDSVPFHRFHDNYVSLVVFHLLLWQPILASTDITSTTTTTNITPLFPAWNIAKLEI